MNTIANLIVALVIFILLFLATFLFTLKAKYSVSNRLFAFFLMLSALDVSGFIPNIVFKSLSNMSMLRNNAIFLQLPVLYLYVLSVCYSDFKLKAKHLVHLFPFVVANLILIPNYYSVDVSQKIMFFENHKNIVELKFNHFLMHLQIGLYLIAMLFTLKKTKKIYLENFANSRLESYHWLFQLTIALAGFYTIALVKNIFKFSEYEGISEWIRSSLLLFQLVIVCWYLFKALNHPNLFRNIDSKLKLVNDIVTENKDLSLAIDANSLQKLEELKKIMIEERLFLEPGLTIQDVADSVEIPVKELSILINYNLNQHFFDYINSYRIEAAMEILRDSSKREQTVLEILYEVGFNSKSSFNTFFKKQVGITPTVYRKKHLN